METTPVPAGGLASEEENIEECRLDGREEKLVEGNPKYISKPNKDNVSTSNDTIDSISSPLMFDHTK